MAWWHAEGKIPDWEIPDLRQPGFPSPLLHTRTLTAYPQDINENAFDIGHFPTLHRYRTAEVQDADFTGTRSTSHLVTRRHFPVVGALQMSLQNEGHGVGFTRALANIPQIRCQADAYFFSTPTGPRTMDFRVAVSIKCPSPARRTTTGHSAVSRALSWLLTRTLGPSMRTDLESDYAVWSNKVYLPRLRLAEGDGPITRYRRWARQFYTWPEDGASSPADDRTLHEPGAP
jgi:hypothetical protein